MTKPDIRDVSLSELVSYLASVGERTFRAAQVFSAIYQKGVTSFDAMHTLPDSLRARLAQDFLFSAAAVAAESISTDGTVKVLFTLRDGQVIESVYIPAKGRGTVCVSTQVGCKFGCQFCASGVGGWVRHLTVSEILGQILYMKKYGGVTHIVFMGIGEPLDNYEAVLKAVRMINAKEAFGIAARRITISTCGVVPQIERLSKEGLQIELAVSLHGYSDEVRNTLMPINAQYPLGVLIAVCKKYSHLTKRQVTFEYIMLKDVTCHRAAAQQLVKLLTGWLSKVNLIIYNPVVEFPYTVPSKKEIYAFRDMLLRAGVPATVRLPRGRDASAACGQLRHACRKKQ